jgi:hypothetical protein
LEGPELEKSFGSLTLPASGELTSSQIPLKGLTDLSGPIVVKVVGIDAKGHRVAAWADVNLARSAP